MFFTWVYFDAHIELKNIKTTIFCYSTDQKRDKSKMSPTFFVNIYYNFVEYNVYFVVKYNLSPELYKFLGGK